MVFRRFLPLLAALPLASAGVLPAQPPASAPTAQPVPKPQLPNPVVAHTTSMAEVLANSKASDWRTPDPERVLYLQMASGRVVMELYPDFAPAHVRNIQVLARERYFDGLVFVRSQDNYVVQWGDPTESRSLGSAQKKVMAELARGAHGLPFTSLPDGDVYAPEVGFSQGNPAARDLQQNLAWLTHCYGMVGVGRGNELDSASGAEMYVVIGHAPRHLDRNVTLVGRVLQGMDLLSVLPRGKGNLGFYEEASQQVKIDSIRLESEVPAAERTPLEVLRTDTATFTALVQSRRFRREEWFKNEVGHIELCNVPLPVRPRSVPPAP